MRSEPHGCVLESFKQSVLIRMNPFHAMQVFAYEPSVSSILARDDTVDGKAFWNKKFTVTFGVGKTPNNDTKRLEIVKDQVLNRMYEEINLIHNVSTNNMYGIEQAPRHFFMWVWMFYRILTKELVRIMTERAHVSIADMYHPLIRKMTTYTEPTVAKNILVDRPSECSVSSSETYSFFSTLTDAFYSYIHLPVTSQYQIYLVAKPIVDIMMYMKMCRGFVKESITAEKMVRLCKRYENRSIIDVMVVLTKKRYKQKYGSFILDNGNECIHAYIAKAVDTVSTTYPTNTDAGEGIFTG